MDRPYCAICPEHGPMTTDPQGRCDLCGSGTFQPGSLGVQLLKRDKEWLDLVVAVEAAGMVA